MSPSPRDHGPGERSYDERDLLREQFRLLLRYRLLIVCGVLLGLGSGAWLGLTTADTYVATSEITVRVPAADPFDDTPLDKVAMGSERRTALSHVVAQRAVALLGLRPGEAAEIRQGLQVANPPNTAVLRFSAFASSPRLAAERANAFADAYLANRRADADSTIAHTVQALTRQRGPLLARRDELARKLEVQGQGSATHATARGDLATVTGRISDLNEEISSLQALDTSGGRVITAATPPSGPSGPGLLVLLALGSVVGIALGLLAAWARLLFDPGVRSPGDVTRALRAPVLGALPRDRGGRADEGSGQGFGQGAGQVTSQLLAEGRLAEEYRSVAFRLAYDETFAQRRRLLVVAPRGGIETPLSVSVNLTAAFAEMGMDALLVEADLRTPSLAQQLRQADAPRRGWSPARLDGGWPAGLRMPIDAGGSGVFHLVPGRRVSNVPRALTSPETTELLGHADAENAVVVVLAPAVLSYADAIALIDRVDGVLVVCDPGQVRRDDLDRVRELVVGAGGVLLGAVLHSWGTGAGRSDGRHRRGEPAGPGRPAGDPGPDVLGLRAADQAGDDRTTRW